MSADEAVALPNPPTSLAELKHGRRPLRNSHRQVMKSLDPMDRVAVWITDKVGTFGFFLVIFVWTFIWLAWNFLAPARLKFDPPMGFVFWLFISNVLQILLMPLIMVGQNLQGAQSEARAEHDLEVNVKAEKEIEVILEHLEYQNAVLTHLVRKLGDDLAPPPAPGKTHRSSAGHP
jgi:uncharacterized membrane protein